MRFLGVLLAAALPLAAQEPLTLEELLRSVERHYPPLLAALQDRVIAAADVLAATGRFDLSLKNGYEGDYLGRYRNGVYRATIEQATQFQGITYFAGYQLGRGEFASYDGKLQTDLGGEWKVGVRLPFLRERSLDSRRAELRKARIGQRIAELGVDQQRLVIRQLAARRYYEWVAAGLRHRVAKAVQQVAEQRDGQLREAARLGQIPAVDVTDNQRAILTRRAQTIEAERALQLAAIELSLFYRDDAGAPVLPGPERLPAAFPAPRDIDEQRLEEDIELAWRRRPEIRRFREQRSQAEVDRKLAQNQLLPAVDLSLSFASQLGERRAGRGPNDLVASLVFDLPAQRRAARGRDLAALARIKQFDHRERFARDQIAAEVRDAYSALKAAYERARVLREEVDVARQLETAERVRFELGEGNLFLVNLREQATYETELRELAALAEYFRALAFYEYAIAEALSRPGKS
ncbi:MAG: TolC family protein [Bryobacteraceae bacterium]